MWPRVFQMIRRLPTLKEVPGPMESVPGITNKKLDNTRASLSPQHLTPRVSRRRWLIMCLKWTDRSVME